MKITAYEAICNLGGNINEIYKKAIIGDTNCFDNIEGYLKDKPIRAGIIHSNFNNIDNEDYNIRCNRMLAAATDLIKDKIKELKEKYTDSRIAIITATTNSGVDEYELSKNSKHYEIGNPASFLNNYLNLKGYYASVSTACSSGLIAFSLAKDLMDKDIADAVVIGCTDALSKVPVYGFNSLEVLSDKPVMPFSKNRTGMNIGEAAAVFITEKDTSNGIKVLGIGKSSDIYHSTTPDPKGEEAVNAIKMALKQANISAEDIDYINAHGTGTIANDLMEANAIYQVFKNNVPVSSTKPMTGHCLGAAAGIETALCCKLLDEFNGRLYPNVYDGIFDDSLPEIKLADNNQTYKKCKICMCNSFGFGGTNAIMIIEKRDEK